jgi:Uma2 family endonuclease
MVAAQHQEQEPSQMTEAEYLAFEEKSEIKYEFVNGRVFAMAGASWNHNVVCQSTSTTLDNQLADKPCFVVSNDLRLKVESKVSFRYPDVMVIYGEPRFVDNRIGTIDNPTVIVEVLSSSTALEDHNAKLDEYTRLESVEEYVLISQDEAKIERYFRQDSGDWLYTKVKGREHSLNLLSIGCKLDLATVYKKIKLKGDGVELPNTRPGNIS